MRDEPAYWREPYLKELQTRKIDKGSDGEGAWIVVEDSILYPPGGGQPADRGWVNSIEAEAAAKTDEGFLIRLASPVEAQVIDLKLDWERRFDHMQQHSAQHLLTSVAEDKYGWKTTAFHLGEKVSDIELDVASTPVVKLEELEAELARVVAGARKVVPRFSTPEAMTEEGIRCRGLPEDHSGAVRVIEIEGIDTAACGGTHVRTTSEIGAICLLGTEKMRGGTRLYFIAGSRVQARMREIETRSASLRKILDTSDEEMTTTIETKLQQLKDESRRSRRLSGDLASALVDKLRASGNAFQALHLGVHGRDLVFAVANQFASASDSGWLLLTNDEGAFALVSADASDQLETYGRQVAEVIDGRGGGRGKIFQGKANAIHKRRQAETMLRETIED
jgi:Ser-tRNA(Ala) deacylase AlaX